MSEYFQVEASATKKFENWIPLNDDEYLLLDAARDAIAEDRVEWGNHFKYRIVRVSREVVE